MIPIIDSLLGIGKQWMTNRAEKAQAKHKREIAQIESTDNWEAQQADASKNSWKDEWWTVILSLPIILSFVGVPFCIFFMPEKVQLIEEAMAKQFQLLSGVPEWYLWAIAASIGASFGFKTITKFKK